MRLPSVDGLEGIELGNHEKLAVRCRKILQMSLSRLNHRLPRGQTDPEVMQGTAAFHHEIADAVLPPPDPVFDDTAALDAAVDLLDPVWPKYSNSSCHRRLRLYYRLRFSLSSTSLSPILRITMDGKA
jgi:hypothetical protein